MNYLFHLYLSPPIEEAWVGNMMGDFVKGALKERWQEGIIKGIEQHRAVDSFAAQNIHFLSCKRHINPDFRHYRSVMVDMFWDHLLARDWQKYHHQPLDEFVTQVHSAIKQYFSILPDRMKPVMSRMIEHNWLTSYQEEHILERALTNMGKRFKKPFPLEKSMVDFRANREKIENDFNLFITEAQATFSN